MLLQFRRRGRRRLQASFRRGTSYPFWRLGFRQSSFRHITRIFPARRPVRLGTAAGFLACYCPLHLSDLGSAIRSRDISSHLCPLRGRYNTAPRGAAAAKYSNAPDSNEHELPPTPRVSWDSGQTPGSASSSGRRGSCPPRARRGRSRERHHGHSRTTRQARRPGLTRSDWESCSPRCGHRISVRCRT